MGPLVTAITLCVLSSVAYALAAVAQERLAAATRAQPTAGLRRVLRTMRQPRWLLAVGLSLVGAALHVLALRYGSIVVVQPLGALTLVFALPVGAALASRRVAGREWRGAAATVVGLAGFLWAIDAGRPAESLTDDEVITLVAATAGALVVACATALALTRGRGLLLAAASGLAFGVASVLTQTLVLRATVDPVPTYPVTGPPIPAAPAAGLLAGLVNPVVIGCAVAVMALAIGGMLLSQAAYRAGLGGPLAVLTVANPIAASAIGMAMLGQASTLTPVSATVAALAAVLATRGVFLLATASMDKGHRHGDPGSPPAPDDQTKAYGSAPAHTTAGPDESTRHDSHTARDAEPPAGDGQPGPARAGLWRRAGCTAQRPRPRRLRPPNRGPSMAASRSPHPTGG
jgi:drug/metabolite transporter (DMT)-like permease